MISFLLEWGETLMCSSHGKNRLGGIGCDGFGYGLIDCGDGLVLDFRILLIEFLNETVGFHFLKAFGSPAGAAV
jgi:hypothetical protein